MRVACRCRRSRRSICRALGGQLYAPVLCNRVFSSLYWPSPNNLPSRFRLEYRWLFCERIDALPLLCGRLLDDNEFCESGDKEGSCFLELFVANLRERLDDALNVLPCHFARMLLGNFFNELRLRHQLSHLVFPCSESSCNYLARVRDE